MSSLPAQTDCSELAAAIAELALNFAETDAGVQNVDQATARINQVLESPVTRQDVADSIEAFTRQGQKQSVGEVSQRLNELKQEARIDARLRRKIDSLQQQIESGDFLEPQQRTAKQQTDAINTLRQAKNKLERESNLRQQIDELATRLSEGDLRRQPQPKRQFGPDIEALEVKRDALQARLRTEIMSLRPKTLIDRLGEPGNFVRSIITAYDLSAVLRQGGKIALANPVRALRSIGPMLRSFGSERQSIKINNEIRSRPNANFYDIAKLEITDPGGLPTQREEQFMSDYARLIPGVKGSERAFTTFLNKLRADSFDAMSASLAKDGQPTMDEYKAIADYINIATGRGDLGRFGEAARVLNSVFFAPRYVASQFQWATMRGIRRGPASVRKLVAKEYLKTLTGFAAIMGLGVLAGAEVEHDPRSSDFIKMKFGDTRVDFGTGILQPVVLVSRQVWGQKKTARGRVVDIRGDVKFGQDDGWDVLTRFFRSKLSPGVGMAINLVAGENVVGERMDVDSPEGRKNLLVNNLIPISWQDLNELAREQGIPETAILGVLSLLGAGVATYDTNKKR